VDLLQNDRRSRRPLMIPGAGGSRMVPTDKRPSGKPKAGRSDDRIAPVRLCSLRNKGSRSLADPQIRDCRGVNLPDTLGAGRYGRRARRRDRINAAIQGGAPPATARCERASLAIRWPHRASGSAGSQIMCVVRDSEWRVKPISKDFGIMLRTLMAPAVQRCAGPVLLGV